MEERHYILPSNVFESLNGSDTGRPRPPLIDSAGNAQYRTVATSDIYGDHKGQQARPPPNFCVPTLPSQPAHRSNRSALETRKSQIKSQRSHRFSKSNPIFESKNYQDYRGRQIRDKEDQKWPDDLERLFIEALYLLPKMGRRKFSINGKPHGRNELISIWLWLGYCESLPPGQKPDQQWQRTRKQVSSHIQVLKNFMRGHPAFDRLFNVKQGPGNGFEDSFKNDPYLRALALGRLPHRNSAERDFLPPIKHEISNPLSPSTCRKSLSPLFGAQSSTLSNQSLRPSLFRMYMTVLRDEFGLNYTRTEDTGNEILSTKVHTYSDSILKASGESMLELFPDWQKRFPLLAQLYSTNELTCDIIHIEVSLELRYGSLPERSELWGRFELLVPGQHNQQAVWRCTQSMFKPADLYGPPTEDPPFENVTSTPDVERYEPGVGAHIHVDFPALTWAHALQRLSTLEAQFEKAMQTGEPLPTPTTARQYIDQMNMYQEIFCSESPKQPLSRKAVLLWTFKKCKVGEQGTAKWRYLSPSPARSACFSPQPGPVQLASAVMNEAFGTWAAAHNDSIPTCLTIAHPTASNVFDPLSSFDGLPTPSLHSLVSNAVPDMQYPFQAYGYQHVPAENLSFMSHGTHVTHDSDSTLVDVQTNSGGVRLGNSGGGGELHMDHFMSAASILSSFDHSTAGMWDAVGSGNAQTFDSDPEFLTGYDDVSGTGVSHEPQRIWDAGDVDEGKGDGWDIVDVKDHESWDVDEDAEVLVYEDLIAGK